MKPSEFLTDESKWTKRAFARDKSGLQCSIHSQDAQCYCLTGMIAKFYKGSYLTDKLFDVLMKIHSKVRNDDKYQNLPIDSIISFNDCGVTTFEDVKEVLIKARL